MSLPSVSFVLGIELSTLSLAKMGPTLLSYYSTTSNALEIHAVLTLINAYSSVLISAVAARMAASSNVVVLFK